MTERSVRKLVSDQRLVEILNIELGARDDCGSCAFVGPVTRATRPYRDGGNWVRSLSLTSQSGDPQGCGQTAADVITSVAARYNLT